MSQALARKNGQAVAAAIFAAPKSTTTTHAHSYAAKFWATKNFAAYGLRGSWSSIG
ncbi:MAG: hypothetical protein WCG53_03230 [Actinomycetes bacterium]